MCVFVYTCVCVCGLVGGLAILAMLDTHMWPGTDAVETQSVQLERLGSPEVVKHQLYMCLCVCVKNLLV